VTTNVLCGLDIATKVGAAIILPSGEVVATSFYPSGKRPEDLAQGDIEAAWEGHVFNEFRDWLADLFFALGVTDVAVEKPLPPPPPRMPKKQKAAGTTFAEPPQYSEEGGYTDSLQTRFRLYGQVGVALGLCNALNIGVTFVPQGTWRVATVGCARAPKHIEKKKRRAWIKQQAKDLCQRLRVRINNADEAEAVCIALWFREYLRLGTFQREGELPL
jgi:hypothetical protein